MKKLFIIIFILRLFNSNAQVNDSDQISVRFENSSAIEAIEKIEQLSGYTFFYLDHWLKDISVRGDYENISLPDLLNAIFKNSIINYHITRDKRIILTQSSFIDPTLPDHFLVEIHDEILETNSMDPLITHESEEDLSKNKTIETIRIGKENRATKKRYFLLKGQVRDSKTNLPIPDLVIRVRNKNINTVTDSGGNYSLNLPPGLNFLETKSIGYEDAQKRIIIYSAGQLDFQLVESSEMLEELIIEADRDRNVKEAISGITQIKIEEIKNIPLVLGERDILKVATTMPGIKTAGEGSSGYSVRGGKEDQNLILLDQALIYNPSHFFGIFSALNPFTTGNVNIYKGNIPAEFGGRLSSVFDIKTKKGNEQHFAGEASIGPITGNLTLEIPVVKDKSSLLIGGRGTYSDWVLKKLDNESLKNSKASFYDLVAKYQHRINENNSLEFTGYYSNDAFSITSDSLFQYSNRLTSLKWIHDFNTKSTGTFTIANSRYKFNIGYDANIDTDFDIGYNVNETELKYKLNYVYSDKHKFNIGISSKIYTVNPGRLTPKGNESIVEEIQIPNERGLESAVFISDDFEVNTKLLFNVGVRYSMFASLGKAIVRTYVADAPKNESTVSGTIDYKNNEVIKTFGGPEVRASLRYFLAKNLSAKASYNSTYQYIHTLSNTTTISPTDTWKLSDYHIKPQQAHQLTLGLYKNFKDHVYELSLEGYYKKSKNILDYKIGSELLLNEYIETEVLQGKGKAYGIEFLAKKTKGNFNGWIGYSYSRSFLKLDSEFAEERVNNGDFFPANFDKPHDLSIITNYKLTKRYSLSVNFLYQTGRPITYPVGKYFFEGEEHVLYSDRNKFRIPDYYRLDIGINIEGNHKIKKFAHSFWNISVYNVLGRNNPYSVFFVTENGEIKAYQSSIFSIPVPTITYNFKF